MKIIVFLVLMCGAVIHGRAQQNYFVYLQTDNKQAFYVRVNDKLYSSSASGYVVIPKLQSGTHTISVGFPKNEWPLQVIPVPVGNKDQGYLLKNFDNKGWGLFNLQTLDVLMANNNTNKDAGSSTTNTRTDAFSTTLADVVNTPSIKEIDKLPVKEQTPVKQSEIAPSVEIPKATEAATTAPAVKQAIDPVLVSAIQVQKIGESNTAEGRLMSYLVQNESVADTVHLIITPDESSPAAVTTTQDSPYIEKPVSIPAKPDIGNSAAPKFIDIELSNPNTAIAKDSLVSNTVDQKQVAVKAESVAVPTVSVDEGNTLKMINSDCKSAAGEADFLKMRKRMISQRTEEQMIEAAQKMFRQKCYSVDQVKNLSVLLLKEESKYKLFDSAYPFVHDSGNFKTLESQLSDPYFISRFKAMIRK